MKLASASDEPFWEHPGQIAVTIGITIVVVLIAWLIVRCGIIWLTRGIERGTELSQRQVRKLAKYGKTPPPPDYEKDLRLERERRRMRAHTIRAVLISATTVLAFGTAFIIILSALGVPIAALIASAGVLSVALGFGAQSLVKDLISGVFMLIEDQYGVGDIIDVGEATGTVEEVGLRSVRLRALDGTVWYVPNGQIVRVGNMTRTWSRAMIEVRFHYDTDLEAARQAMFDAVAEARKDPDVDAAILGEPEVPGIEQITYNSVTLRLVMQVNPSTQWTVEREIRRQMRRIFVERGIELSGPETAQTIGVHVPGTEVDGKVNPKAKKSRSRGATDPAHQVLPPENDDE